MRLLRPRSILLLTLLLLAFLAPPAWSQYIYVDTNGDGKNSSTDYLNPSSSTVLDVWLDTNHNRAGTEVPCANGTGVLGLFNYEFILHATGGTIAWSNFENLVPGISPEVGQASNGTDFHSPAVLGGAFTNLFVGLQRLARIAVVPSGAAALNFVSSTPLSAAYGTRFGSDCLGVKWNNTIELGADFLDADGVSVPVSSTAFATGSNDNVNFQSSGVAWTDKCFYVQPDGGSFAITDIDLGSVRLESANTGSAREIPASTKVAVVGDANGDHVQDLQICFSRAELERLFCQVAGANNTRTVALTGLLYGGGRFRATLTLKVSFGTVAPCPMALVASSGGDETGLTAHSSRGTLHIRTTRRGFLRVQLFDVSGRLVRELWNEGDRVAGDLTIRIEPRSSKHGTLASGIYFYRVLVPGGSATGRFAVLR